MAEGSTRGAHLRALSIDELHDAIVKTKHEIELCVAVLHAFGSDRERSIWIAVEAAGTFLGLVLAPPTGGISFLVTFAGLAALARDLKSDSEVYNKARRLMLERDRLRAELNALVEEVNRRGL